ncbi:MAG: hypothetical protein ACHQAX_04585 [Gammaproteobacteria bacterium]
MYKPFSNLYNNKKDDALISDRSKTTVVVPAPPKAVKQQVNEQKTNSNVGSLVSPCRSFKDALEGKDTSPSNAVSSGTSQYTYLRKQKEESKNRAPAAKLKLS